MDVPPVDPYSPAARTHPRRFVCTSCALQATPMPGRFSDGYFNLMMSSKDTTIRSHLPRRPVPGQIQTLAIPGLNRRRFLGVRPPHRRGAVRLSPAMCGIARWRPRPPRPAPRSPCRHLTEKSLIISICPRANRPGPHRARGLLCRAARRQGRPVGVVSGTDILAAVADSAAKERDES